MSSEGPSTAAGRWFHWRGRATAASLLVAVLLLVAFSAVAYAGAPAQVAVTEVHVDVIGDSLSTGYKTPGDTWPDQEHDLIGAMGLKADITNASENGAGYVQHGDDGDVFLDLVNRIVTSHSQVVVLFGSDNDTGQPGLATAVQKALARVSVLAPHATVIVVGPTSESNDAHGVLAPIVSTLSHAAAASGARFVDPVALGWFQGADNKYLSSDMEHPNTAGETYLAWHFTAVLAPSIKNAMHQNRLRDGPFRKVLP